MYAVNDVLVLKPVFQEQQKLLLKAGLVDVALLEFSIIPAVVDIELSGMLLDMKKLDGLKEFYSQRLKTIEGKLRSFIQDVELKKQQNLFKESNINFKSPVQVKELFSKLGFKLDSTETDVLKKIDHPVAGLLVEHRKVSKLISSFIEKLPKHVNFMTERIHPDFFQLGTEAGRFTCQNPNLQQIPKEQQWRDLFIAPDGYKILTADYSQIELRILAEHSQDKAFLEAYSTGQDLHTRTASEMLDTPIDKVSKSQRDIAKTINFGLCYGMTSKGLSDRLNISSEEAESFINAYFRAYPQVKDTLQELGMKAVTKRYSETLSGRKRYFKPGDSFSYTKSLERKGRNTPIQGTCGDILKKAIQYLMSNLKGYDVRIINLVHDELVIEVNENHADDVKQVVERDMVRAGADFIKSVPIEVDITIDKVWRK